MQTLLVASVLTSAAAINSAHVTKFTNHKTGQPHLAINLGGAKECNVCVQFMDQFLDQLLNIILNGGVIGSCSDLCNKIPGSTVEKGVCDLLCGAVGVKEFVDLIQKADLDPIWLCEEVDQCEMNKCQSNCATIGDITVDPPTGPAGTLFNFEASVQTLNSTIGVLSVALAVEDNDDPKHFGDGESGFVPQPQVGTYTIKFQLDSSGGGDFPYPPGNYSSMVEACGGMCGSKHAGTVVFGQKSGPSFVVSQ